MRARLRAMAGAAGRRVAAAAAVRGRDVARAAAGRKRLRDAGPGGAVLQHVQAKMEVGNVPTRHWYWKTCEGALRLPRQASRFLELTVEMCGLVTQALRHWTRRPWSSAA